MFLNYLSEEYYFDSALVSNCMGISFNRSGLNRLGFDMKLVRLGLLKELLLFISRAALLSVICIAGSLSRQDKLNP